jgi:hypothetical protein
MRSNTARAVAGVAVIALAIVLFIVLSGGDDNDSTTTTPATTEQPQGGGGTETPAVQTIQIQGGAPVGGVADIEATSGDTVEFRVVSDEEGEVHVHGYDVEKEIAPGTPLVMSFPADIEGSFEVELHAGGGEFQIADLSVSPG